eukprot:Blabericola_migrator_1__9733@NODE_532_length_7786_cov_102_495531_g405_i0_p6_GENE_NODE_532_length_7786_cov_102_495531_g405_i0NODE_532_length_7786_cov_102_495531_g405_i0_p6_ORF_typecomplete_len235_score59_01eIF3_subunit/PF08597_10/1_5e17BTAD/PF03704_17/0_065BTAD/PF03704_17/2_3e03_NODE_532_length_7786_cov_102_495531_g405_i044555159
MSDVPDDWSDWDAESVEEKPIAPKQTTAPASKTTTGGTTVSTAPKGYSVPKALQRTLDDPSAEAERKQLIQEHRDLVLAGADYGVDEGQEDELLKRAEALAAKYKATKKSVGKSDGGPVIAVNTLTEIQELCEMLDTKIAHSPAKSGSWLQFLDRLLASCATKMEPKDLQTLGRKVKDHQAKREVEKRRQATNSKKGTDLKVNTRDYQDELDIYDGVLDGDSQDEVYKDDEDFM